MSAFGEPLSNKGGPLIEKGQPDRFIAWVASFSKLVLLCVAYTQGPRSNCITSREWSLGVVAPCILAGPLHSVPGTAEPVGRWDSH